MGLQWQEEPKVKAAVAAVLAVLARHKQGDVVPWAVIEAAAGFERYTQHWSAFFKRVQREFLRTTGVFVCAFRFKDGLELLTDQESLTVRAEYRQRKSMRQCRRNERELAAIPDNRLSDAQRVVKSQQLASAREGKRAAMRQLRLSYALAKPSGGDLPRPAPRRKQAA